MTGAGQSASRWFYQGLDLHPDIHCYYGKDDLSEGLVDKFRSSIKDTAKYLDFVHRHMAKSIQALVSDGEYLGIVKLIRNPITRVYCQSILFAFGLANSDRSFSGKVDQIISESQQDVERWVAKYALSIDEPWVKAFISLCCKVSGMVDEIRFSREVLKLEDDFHIPIERLTTNRGYYQYIVGKLTQGKVAVTADYLNSAPVEDR